MRFSRQQLQTLDTAAEARGVDALCRLLRDQHAEAVDGLDDAELARRVQVGIARARGYGLTHSPSIVFFVLLMFDVAPNFDEHPLLHSVLTDEEEPPEARVEALATLVPGWVFTQARRARDDSAWTLPQEDAR